MRPVLVASTEQPKMSISHAIFADSGISSTSSSGSAEADKGSPRCQVFFAATADQATAVKVLDEAGRCSAVQVGGQPQLLLLLGAISAGMLRTVHAACQACRKFGMSPAVECYEAASVTCIDHNPADLLLPGCRMLMNACLLHDPRPGKCRCRSREPCIHTRTSVMALAFTVHTL